MKERPFVKCLNSVLFLCLALLHLSCNQANSGFSAPSGSTVAVTGVSSVPGNQDNYVVATISVTVPFQETSVPGNNIFVTATCSVCSLYDRATGESVTLADPTKVTAVSNPYTFTTKGDGTYQVVMKLDDPADLGVSTYSATLIVDIGVASTTLVVTSGS